MRGIDGAQDIARVAAGGNGQQHVAGLSERGDLLGEHLVKIVIVGDRRQRGRICRQRDRRQGRAFAFKAVQQLAGKMLGIGGRTAVAAGKDLAIGEQALGHLFRGARYGRGQRLHGIQFCLRALLELAAHTCQQFRIHRCGLGGFQGGWHGAHSTVALAISLRRRYRYAGCYRSSISKTTRPRVRRGVSFRATLAVTLSPPSMAHARAALFARGT